MFAKSNEGPPANWYETPAEHDLISRQFISIICWDPELDFMLSRVGHLFVDPPPKKDGGYCHHDGLRTVG